MYGVYYLLSPEAGGATREGMVNVNWVVKARRVNVSAKVQDCAGCNADANAGSEVGCLIVFMGAITVSVTP